MRMLRSTALAVGLLSSLSLPGCSSSDTRQFNGDLFIVSCSLGCTSGQEGEQVFCSVVNTFQNLEISILFSEPIDLFSVNSSSFRVVDVANGTTPSGQFFGDPLDPRRLIFRPSLTFDANGNPIFALKPNTSYEIFIPGLAQEDSPPHIRSVTGRPNQSRLRCTIFTSEGINDPVPGPPSVQTLVDVVTSTDANGQEDGWIFDVPVTNDPEVREVSRVREITMEFGDIMNVATLVNPDTGKAPFIRIEVDDDGNLATDDRIQVEGTYTFAVDPERLRTFLNFQSAAPLPSAGPNAPLNPRRITVTIPESCQDLVANSVTVENGGGTKAFVTIESQFGEVTIPEGGEDFITTANEDPRRSGAFWGSGRLQHGLGGGSGSLGDLIIPGGAQVTLNTDSQTFPLTIQDGMLVNTVADLIGNPDPTSFPDTIGNFPDSVTITDGAFPFNRIFIEPGGYLRLEGTNPARLYSRGTGEIQDGGIIDLGGVTPPVHPSSQTVINPEDELPTPVNAANGGDGGFGADRFDMSVNTQMGQLGAPENDVVSNPGADTNGRLGGGVGRSTNPNTGLPLAGGTGGRQSPGRYPILNTATIPAQNNNHGVNFNVTDVFDTIAQDTQCRSLDVGGTGAGGAYATDGGPGVSASTDPTADWPPGASNSPADTPGARSSDLELATPDENNAGYTQRRLEWWNGNLRGGSGGGGGGNHTYGTWANGHNDPNSNNCIGQNSFFWAWHDHSAARGGFGGGALHLASGRLLTVDGVIDASGGDGGSARQAIPGNDIDFGQFAMPGGAGAGGAIRLQAAVVELGDQPGRLLVNGGTGGTGVWNLSLGGAGGTGLVRIEDAPPGNATRSELAPSITPFEPADDSLSWVSVDAGGFQTPVFRPGSVTASVSCWLRPTGNFFALSFLDDQEDENTGDPAKMGWNMMVIWDDGTSEQLVPFRGLNGLFTNSFENEFGKNLGPHLGMPAAPVVVRFQGARSASPSDLCDVDPNDPNDIVPGSLTPWVDHPRLLNDFPVKSNMVRFVVLFDGTDDPANNDTPGQILSTNIRGVTSFGMRAIPD